jgi:hypothetical protein
VGLLMSIYIPGHGEMSWDEIRVDRAVKEYDERLFFARNAETWDWCVYIRMPRPEPPYPVIGFGREVPSVDVVMRKVYNADTTRHGWQIFDEIVESQEAYKKQFRDAADEATEESAEVVEHFLRQHGKSPVIKEFINFDIPKGGEAGAS